MARPRKPTNLLHLNAAFDKNPQRLKDRPDVAVLEVEIGRPPRHWRVPETDPGYLRGRDLRKIWYEIVGLAPWLVRSQRMTLEDVCVLRWRARNETLKPSELNLMRLMSNSLGLDGVGKGAPAATPQQSSDPRDEFERKRG